MIVSFAVGALRDTLARRMINLQQMMIAALTAQQAGQLDVAAKLYAEVLKHDARPIPKILTATLLPAIYASMDELKEWRGKMEAGLNALHGAGVRHDIANDFAVPAFRTAYQGLVDKQLMKLLSGLNKLPFSERNFVADRPPRQSGAKIRVGFISTYFRNHTIGRLNEGLIRTFPRDRFDVFVFSGTPRDDVAQRIARSATHFEVLQPQLPRARRAIAAHNLDVLFYTDLQMEPYTYTLAHSRLAPVQCVTWGHPETTGIDAIDYFISSKVLDVEAASAHYTEKLVRLDNVAVCYERPTPTTTFDRAEFDLPADKNLYGCPQTLIKLHPQFDTLAGEILRRDPNGLVVLLEGQHATFRQMLENRWAKSMPDVAERMVWVNRTDRDGFLRLNACFDVSLDPVHFGGGNTSYEALSIGLPIVTLPSGLLRGRITLAQYEKMGYTDLVAKSPSEYVDIAVKLGTDKTYNAAARERILANCDKLFNDMSGVHDLANFFASVARA